VGHTTNNSRLFGDILRTELPDYGDTSYDGPGSPRKIRPYRYLGLFHGSTNLGNHPLDTYPGG